MTVSSSLYILRSLYPCIVHRLRPSGPRLERTHEVSTTRPDDMVITMCMTTTSGPFCRSISICHPPHPQAASQDQRFSEKMGEWPPQRVRFRHTRGQEKTYRRRTYVLWRRDFPVQILSFQFRALGQEIAYCFAFGGRAIDMLTAPAVRRHGSVAPSCSVYRPAIS